MRALKKASRSLTQSAFVDNFVDYLSLRGINNVYGAEARYGHIYFQYYIPQCVSVWVDYVRKENRIRVHWEVNGFSHLRYLIPTCAVDDEQIVNVWEILPH